MISCILGSSSITIACGRRLVLAYVLLLTSWSATAGDFNISADTSLETLKNSVIASQFLTRSTFGPTFDEINELATRMGEIGQKAAMEEWIDEQLNIGPTYHHSLTLEMIEEDGDDLYRNGAQLYRTHAWWEAVINAPDQLRQRMAWALAQIFVINDKGAGFSNRASDTSGQPQYLGVVDYYDMLVSNSFGNYRELLEDVTLHPIMGVFLSHVKNPKGNPELNQFPDENYAREILQLFSIGLYQLKNNGVYRRDANGDLIPTYDNETIKSFARVFTGFSYGGHLYFNSGGRNYHDPMDMFEEFHDVDEKVLLNGTVLPAAQSGLKDINDALDNIASHKNVPMFISRLLIQRFVKSNPSKGYISRVGKVFRNNGQGVRGDFKAIIKAILLDKEALKSLNLRYKNNPARLSVRQRSDSTERSRLREPVLRYSALLRSFHSFTGRIIIPNLYTTMNQGPYQSPSVFNFYLPDHLPAGVLQDYEPNRKIPNGAIYAPEFQIATSVVNNTFANRIRNDVVDSKADFRVRGEPFVIPLDFSYEESLADDLNALLSHLDLLLCSGSFSQASKQQLDDIITNETDESESSTRVRSAITVMLTSPECSIHE